MSQNDEYRTKTSFGNGFELTVLIAGVHIRYGKDKYESYKFFKCGLSMVSPIIWLNMLCRVCTELTVSPIPWGGGVNDGVAMHQIF